MFSSTKCSKCENRAFKLEEINVQGSNFKMFAVQCVSCSTPFGITEFYDNGALLKEQEKAIAGLEKKIDHLQYGMGQVIHALQSMRR
jgi:predicted nucleic-acid-binding Zn-ribbon protein